MPAFTNRLIGETSPYLLQHAHNPVDWYPWGAEALQAAKMQDRPILVSIGYAACHWCHVMERESFEDPDTAGLMNQHFINIKIDREERPDLDHIYMDAVQAMTGSGGWPLNVFLTPDARPFYGGTYYPPRPAFNRPSWKELLLQLATAYRERRQDISDQAENLTRHLITANNFGLGKNLSLGFSREDAKETFKNLMKQADRKEGGFGAAPKFPQTFSIRFCLHHYYYTGDDQALAQACLSLDKMIAGGIYDQLGGGFARYSTDGEWLAPHFEKMIYDNALLVSVMSEAFQATGNILYKKTIEHTLGFIEREWRSPDGGYYSALDADSEGEEGRYYVWSLAEARAVLGEDTALAAAAFDLTEQGNWENTNILRRKQPEAVLAAEFGLELPELFRRLDRIREKMLRHRETRIRPALDDKILLGWNALLLTAFCKAYAALGEERYRQNAVALLDFLWSKLQVDGTFYHSYQKGQPRHPAFLDDYAYLIQALIALQEITGDQQYLLRAANLTARVELEFGEEETGFFFYTGANQTDVILRKKEIYDGATPSGNATMLLNLYYLAIVFDNRGWRERAERLCRTMQEAVIRHPASFGVWAVQLQALAYGIPEIALIGENNTVKQLEFMRTFIPFVIFQSATQSNPSFPLLSGKPASPVSQFYLCKHYACQTPVTEIDELMLAMAAL